ncbi:hypothetical protein TURU_022041 [Turdus rufiventris]|nr:hypothetical protein TURU_022041 [Turdus rufiventris]
MPAARKCIGSLEDAGKSENSVASRCIGYIALVIGLESSAVKLECSRENFTLVSITAANKGYAELALGDCLPFLPDSSIDGL